MKVKDLVRKEVLNFQPYIPGRPIEEVKREFGIKTKIVKLASNENSLGVNNLILTAIKKSLKEIYRYPEGSSFVLRNLLAKKHKVHIDEVIVGSGTDELIELIGKTFFTPEDEIIVSDHAFIRYKMAGELMGSKVISIPMKNYTHDLISMAKAINNKTKAIFIANPNNPTGTYNTKFELKNFLNSLPTIHYKPLVIIDEAYYDYAKVEPNYPNTIQYCRKYPNIIVLRTFSKIYSLAGLRIGYAIANKEIVSYMNRIRPPFNVNSPAQAAACEILKNKKINQWIEKSIQLVTKGKKYLYAELDKLKLRYIPSAANFILIDISPRTGQEVFEQLIKKGVIIRPMTEYDFPNYIRVTVGTQKENFIFIQKLKQILKNKESKK